MRKLVLLSGLLVALVAAPGAHAGQRSGDGDRLRHGSVIEVRGGHGQRAVPKHRHRAGPPKAWYYKPGRPAHVMPWPPAARHGVVPRPHHHHRPKVVTYVPLPVVLGRLRPHYRSIGHAARHGERYLVSARDHLGREFRIVIDARSGHMVERKFVRW